MKILIIGNLSDQRCGFQNFSCQMKWAFLRKKKSFSDPTMHFWDGTYSKIYERQQRNAPHAGFFPPCADTKADLAYYDVIHIIWNAMTMNHYAGADWAKFARAGVTLSWWDGGPSDASCPFEEWMQVKWSDYPREGYHYMAYPVPDWVKDLPPAADTFTVGASSVRGDGIAEIREICAKEGWATNLPTPGVWLSVEDEIRRLARSTVNVCWYNTPPLWKNRASAPSMLIAAQRPLLINDDPLVDHLAYYTDVYRWPRQDLGKHSYLPHALRQMQRLAGKGGGLVAPQHAFNDLSWSKAVDQFLSVWEGARARA